MVRYFDRNAKDFLRCSLVTSLTNDFTIIAIIRPNYIGNWQGIVTHRDKEGKVSFSLMVKPEGQISLENEGAGSPTKFKVVDDGRSYLIVCRKPAGVTKVLWEIYDFSTKEWTREEGEFEIGNPTSQAEGVIVFGEFAVDEESISAAYTVVYEWNKLLSKAEVEALFAKEFTDDWLATEPVAAWSFGQRTVKTPVVDLTGNGADQIEIQGTTVIGGEHPPIPYNALALEEEESSVELREEGGWVSRRHLVKLGGEFVPATPG